MHLQITFFLHKLSQKRNKVPQRRKPGKNFDIKQLTEIKTTVSPTITLITYNENSTDKTTQNSNNVIDNAIQNNNKTFKNKKK